MLTKSVRYGGLMMVLPVLMMPELAWAQSDEDERRGYQVEGFLIQPSLTTGVAYDNNIFLEDTNENDSVILTVAPRVDFVSTWNRHALRFSLDAEYGAFGDSADDNYLDYGAELVGVYDVSRGARITGSIAYDHDHEGRGSDDIAETLAAAEPVETDEFRITLLGEAAFGRYTVSPFTNFSYLNFDDVDFIGGGTQNNDDRDRIETETGIEVAYDVRSGFSAFVEPAYLRNDYIDNIDDTGLNRDSEGFRVLAGMKVDLTRLIEASVGVGFTHLTYQDAALDDFTGVAVRINGFWTPTRRLDVAFGVGRDVRQTTVAGSSAAIENSIQLGASYDLLRSVTLNANLGYSFVEYDGVNREDNLFNLGFGLDWRVTRDFTLSPGYAFSVRESNTDGLDYRRHVLAVDGAYRF